MKLFQLLKHKLSIFKWIFKVKKTYLDFMGEAILSVSAKWHGELNPVLSYICMFDVLRQRNFSGNFLELGGGYSTVLLPNILNINQVAITSIDLNPGKYNLILNSIEAKKNFLNKIQCIEKLTVSLDEVFFGLESLRLELTTFKREILLEALNKYCMNSIEISAKVANCIYSANGDALRELYTSHQSYAEDLKFYQSNDFMAGSGFCLKLAKENYQANAIFFDCGEISSVAEWTILSKTINLGGYALFHDIFFPKSIKNFLVATFVELSNDWDIIYIDKTSAQGALVAMRRA